MPSFAVDKCNTGSNEVVVALRITLSENEDLSDNVMKLVDDYVQAIVILVTKTTQSGCSRYSRYPLRVTCTQTTMSRFRYLKHVAFHCNVDWQPHNDDMFESCPHLQTLQVCATTNKHVVKPVPSLAHLKLLSLNGFGIAYGFDDVECVIRTHGGHVEHYY